LAKQPRGDTLDFIPCEADRRREATYTERHQIELRNRAAICKGEKVYDP